MNIELFSPTFEEITIKPDQLAALMGYPSAAEVPEPFYSAMMKGLEASLGFCQMQGGVRLFDRPDWNTRRKSIILEGVELTPKATIFNDLRECEAIAVFVGTAGEGVSIAAHRATKDGDSILAFVIDTIGSMVADFIADYLTNQLENRLKPKGWYTTDPYSPGYCGWSVADQPALFSLLPKGFCGITLTDSCLMSPVKSVSGVIGLGPKAKKYGYACERCNSKNCMYRNRIGSQVTTR